MKICAVCLEEFIPSSRHRRCPKCRYEGKTSICSVCGQPARNISKLCIACSNKKRKLSDVDRMITFTLNKARRKKHLINVTKEYLKELFEVQKGKCAYTNIVMEIPDGQCGCKDRRFCASLDRVDSSLGYEEGNVQWVIMAVNFMKNCFTDKETKDLILKIKES